MAEQQGVRSRIVGLRRYSLASLRGFSGGNPKTPTDTDRAHLGASLANHGYVIPMVVRELPDGTAELIDGHSRLAELVARDPGAEFECVVLDVESVAEGRRILLAIQRTTGFDTKKLDAFVRQALDDGAKAAELLSDAGFSHRELDAYARAGAEFIDGLAPERPRPSPPRHRVRPPANMTNADWSIGLGDCIDGLRALADESIDAVVTDPPAGISFMGRAWDSDKGGRDAWVAWLAGVMREALRVLKPGGHAIVWALPRTMHWTMTALEDAGFEIRDVVHHAFGTGFPKSLQLDKAIDAKLGATASRPVLGPGTSGIANAFNESGTEYAHEFDRTGPATAAAAAAALQGVGTSLKPAVEPWIVARKPLAGSHADNAMAHGTGGLNIDETRIGDDVRHNPSASSMYSLGERPMDDAGGTDAVGRWPANFVLSHLPECCAVGTHEDERVVGVGPRVGDASRSLEFGMGTRATTTTTTTTTYQCAAGCAVAELERQSPGASRFFFCAKPSRAEAEAGLDALDARSGGEATARKDGSAGLESPRAGAGRLGGRKNIHPTRKGIALMRWLIRLVSPPRTMVPVPRILDPFAGSGTTGLAALVEGCAFVGFEQEPEYHRIACERIRTLIEDPRGFGE